MFRSATTLRVLIRSVQNTKAPILEQNPVSPLAPLTQRRSQSTQVRAQPKSACSRKACENLPSESQIPIRELPGWVQAEFQARESGTGTREIAPSWSPQSILHQEHPTVDLPWDPSCILESRYSTYQDDKVHSTPKSTGPVPAVPSEGTTNFRYTLDPSSLPKLRANQLALTTEQRQFYEDNGYIVVKNLVTDQALEQFERRFKDYANSRLPIPEGMVVQKELSKRGEKLSEFTLYKLQELYTDEVLFGYCKDENILDMVAQFTGPNVLSVHSMFINKPPIDSSSSRHPLHQEIHYFPIRPEDRIVCTWMPLERTNRENGCLVVVPRSHKTSHLEHDYPDWEGGVNKFYYGIKDASLAEQRMHVEMEPGDCLFFHPLTIHGSGINRSKGFRKAFSCHFASADCDFIKVDGTIQEKLANELLSIYVDKLSADTVSEQLKKQKIDYPTMWKLRSRLVRGEGNFKRA